MKNIIGLLLLLISITLVPSCGCFTAEKRNDPGCIVLHQVIDCSEDVVMSALGPAVAGLIQSYVINPSTSPDWAGLTKALEAAGVKDGGCIIAQLQAGLIGQVTAGPAAMAKAKAGGDALMEYKARHGLTNVKYKVKVNGKVVLL